MAGGSLLPGAAQVKPRDPGTSGVWEQLSKAVSVDNLCSKSLGMWELEIRGEAPQQGEQADPKDGLSSAHCATLYLLGQTMALLGCHSAHRPWHCWHCLTTDTEAVLGHRQVLHLILP